MVAALPVEDVSDVVYHNQAGAMLMQGDSLELLETFEDHTFDMIFADPPYFLSNGGVTCKNGKMVSVNKGRWDKSKGVLKNHEFNMRWLAQCQRILKPNGSIWVSGTHHVIYSIGFAMQTLGFRVLNDIAWFKVNPPPNLSCRYFTHGTETIIWAGRDAATKHTFNYKLMKEMNENKQMKNLWNIMAPRKKEKTHGKHPTQKPNKLLERIVLSSTNEGDLVLDPFSGSGTTGVACVKHGRQYVGIEMDDEYIKISSDRIDEAAELAEVEAAS